MYKLTNQKEKKKKGGEKKSGNNYKKVVKCLDLPHYINNERAQLPAPSLGSRATKRRQEAVQGEGARRPG